MHLEEQALLAGKMKAGRPNSLVSLPALSACLLCQPACFVSLPALSASLPCFMPSSTACSSNWIFLATTESTNKPKQGRQYIPPISLFLILFLWSIFISYLWYEMVFTQAIFFRKPLQNCPQSCLQQSRIYLISPQLTQHR
jgi:hypothetical protein